MEIYVARRIRREKVVYMKQFQIVYQNDESFRRELAEIDRWRSANPSYTTLFRIYSDDMDLEHIKHVCDVLDAQMPDALYLGCTTHANLLNGALEKGHIVMSCTVFEYETTQVKILQLPFTEACAKEAVGALKEYCDANDWVRSVEMHATILGMSLREFCEEMSALRSDIQVFGGGAYNPNMDDTTTYVFSKGEKFLDHGVAFLLLGGNDFHVYSTSIAGWKPLTRQFKVTKATGAMLYELDGEPAFNIYQRFLNISKGEYLISNTLEFPLFMDYKGLEVLRCPLGLNEDGSLMMATEVPEGADVRISFGDPEMILSSIRQDGQTVVDFQPDAIQVFSCAARRAFWGDENVSDETSLFNAVAPTSGLYVSGEFMRIDSNVRNFNITLVLAAMREGEPKSDTTVSIRDTKMDSIEKEERLPLIRRFISFIDATTKELEEANRKLEETNKKLARASITDGLTGLYNRSEIERGIRSSLKMQQAGRLSLVMLDIDDFKKVNDTYGHKEGDNVIIALADVLRKVFGDVDAVYIGRWGGEEFMVLLPASDIDQAVAYAEEIRVEFASVSYELAGHQTVSLGVTSARAGETMDSLCTRVDEAMYMAKGNGKNQVVRLD